ncbi:MAG: PDZ domain-containing protein, partial [Gemmatimonadota bacterium]
VNTSRTPMHTRLYSATLLVLVGATSTLAAQVRSARPAPDSDDARRITRTLLSRFDDSADRPHLGISVESGSSGDTLGILVGDVTAGGPADMAGVQTGDRLTSIDDVSLRLDAADAGDAEMQGIALRRLTRELARHKVGDEVRVRLLRDGRQQVVKVTTVAGRDIHLAYTLVSGMRANMDRASLGIRLGGGGSVRDTIGIFVASVARDGPAEQAGLIEGDRIASINRVDLRVPREDVDDWEAASARARRLTRELAKLKAGDEVELRVIHAGQGRTVRVKTVAARDLKGSGDRMFMIGDGTGMRTFDFTVPPVPPVPPAAAVPGMPPAPQAPFLERVPRPPLPPDAPFPGEAPRFFYFDGGGNAAVRMRMSSPGAIELPRDVRLRTRESLGRVLEVAPRSRHRIRIEM